MTIDQQRLTDYLSHISEAIERIGRYTKGMDAAAFMNDQLVQDAVIRNFEIVGEASNNIVMRYSDFAAMHASRAAAVIRLSDAQCYCSRLLQGGL